MRLTEDQVRQGLQHPDKDVRFFVLQYFANSYSKNTAVMPDVIDLVERLGPQHAFTDSFPIAYLAQTEQTITWAVKRLQRPPTTEEEEEDFTAHITHLLCNADPQLVLPHKGAILDSPGLHRQWAPRLEQRLGLVATPSDQLWQRLEAICEAGKDKMHLDEFPYVEAQELANALSRDVSQADRMMELLKQEVDPEVESALIWLEIFVVQMAGNMRHEPAVPLIVNKLLIDADILLEECIKALTKIGSDAVVQTVRDKYPQAPDFFRLYSAGLFGNIHSDLAVATELELLATERDFEQRIWLANALVDQFSTEAIDAARTALLEDGGDSYDLKFSLVVACKLMAYDVPELKQWEEELAKPRQAFAGRELPAPVFNGFDDESGDLEREPEISPVTTSMKIGRNDPCPCGSGKKFKKCCLNKSKAPR